MKPVVYILKFKSSGRYYVGSTGNLSQRLKQHKSGQTPSTKRLGEVDLVFAQATLSLAIARTAEKRIKSWKRKDYIEKIISQGTISFLSDR